MAHYLAAPQGLDGWLSRPILNLCDLPIFATIKSTHRIGTAMIKGWVKSNEAIYRTAKLSRDIRGFPLRRSGSLTRIGTIWKIYTKTMLPPVRLFNICDAVEHVNQRGIPGDLVECGVWSGGSIALMALWDMRFETARQYHAFDSFEGLPPPTPADNEVFESFMVDRREQGEKLPGTLTWTGICQGDGADTVRAFFSRVGIPRERVIFHVGWFQDTVPAASIHSIAVLRIDGDWYDSTKTCLDHLYDFVSPGGIIIIDDYGTFSGCRRAVDEFRKQRNINTPVEYVDSECVQFTTPKDGPPKKRPTPPV
ncbi:class I SAM-dependent methyltransferase [Rhizobium sp. ARZ01]|uniref:TylF/MycF/NovP-related O-methyltransferase n=1 Tax=Rhizobium sp. ARZ01 TaxID=2769313 RepID=UPI00178491C3|nr:TylF/MycF/NovP-related O-methyltransferase [Rhizobium sp. ARZ01]MBD9374399.1 class I SAM-dependent methyltransferase [Rhizobium sp. ARZ01]